MLVIAHRGASGHAPEHTFAAYDLAVEQGADYLEQDLQQTRDGELVVLHDDTVDRTTDGSGPVSALTLDELRRLDAGDGQRVPTLREVFARYGRDARYYVETKAPERADRMEERLVALIAEHGLGDRVLLQSFSTRSLLALRALDPSLPLIQLVAPRHSDVPLAQVATYAAGVGPSRRIVTAEGVAEAHAAGLEVHPYTVDDPDEMAAMRALGVDGLFTNYPDRLRALLDAG